MPLEAVAGRVPQVAILVFFFNDTATTEIYTLSLHDALPIWWPAHDCRLRNSAWSPGHCSWLDRKSTRLNSSHLVISYAVFCLKKQKHDGISLAGRQAAARRRTTDAYLATE